MKGFLIGLILIGTFLRFGKAQRGFNPSILQDTRNLPKVDGTFGFLYRTEDGISHAAKGDSNGVIQGTFSYTDPTGLKVNYNYHAGSRVAPGYNYEPIQAAPKYSVNSRPAPRYSAPEPYYDDNYQEPQPSQYRPREVQYTSREEPQPQYAPRQAPQPQYRPQYSPRTRGRQQYRDAADVYQQRRSRQVPRENDVYDDYNYRQ